jgi:hypothetical protein
VAVKVLFEDGPAVGRTEDYTYLSTALPSLAWSGDSGRIEAVYHRSADTPEPDGVWRYHRVG